jgi:hypothetical protein
MLTQTGQKTRVSGKEGGFSVNARHLDKPVRAWMKGKDKRVAHFFAGNARLDGLIPACPH